MRSIRVDLVDQAVWDWLWGLLLNPENIRKGLLDMQEENRRKNQALYDRLDLIKGQLADNMQQQDKLIDLFLLGNFDKELLIDRKDRLETTTASLLEEQNRISSHLGDTQYSEKDLVAVEDFIASIRDGLEVASFDRKRQILDLLDVHGTLSIDNDERVLYVSCLIYQQPQSLVLTSPS